MSDLASLSFNKLIEKEFFYYTTIIITLVIIISFSIYRSISAKNFSLLNIQECFYIGTSVQAITAGLKLLLLAFKSECIKMVLGGDRWILCIGGIAVMAYSLGQLKESSNKIIESSNSNKEETETKNK